MLELIEAGLDPDCPSDQGQTPLMFAALAGNVNMVELLLSHGSDAKATDHAGCTVAHYACTYGHLDILHALRGENIDWNAKANMEIGQDLRKKVALLHLAAVLENNSVLQFLLAENLVKDVNCVTDLEETPLFMAAWCCQPRNVALLLSKGGNPDLMARSLDDGPAESSVHIAARLGDRSVMLEFIKHKCNLKIPGYQGLDSEMIAWTFGHTDLAKMIGEYTQEYSKLSSRALFSQ